MGWMGGMGWLGGWEWMGGWDGWMGLMGWMAHRDHMQLIQNAQPPIHSAAILFGLCQ